MMFLPIFCFALAIILIVLSVRILIFRRWFKVWIQASFALLALFIAILLLVSSFDLHRYGKYHETERIAVVTTNKTDLQRFNLILELEGGLPTHFDVYGDMWQLDVRLLVWDEIWDALGFSSLYRLDRLSGRYHSIVDERSKPKTLYDLWNSVERHQDSDTSILSDFSQWINTYTWFPGSNLLFGGSTFMPMIDGARFGIYLTQGGLNVKAENEMAEKALTSWR